MPPVGMAQRIWESLKIGTEEKKKLDRLSQLNNKAKAEHRNLSESEQREWDKLTHELEVGKETRQRSDQLVFLQSDEVERMPGGGIVRGYQAANYGFTRSGYRTQHENLGQFIRDIRFPDNARDLVTSVGGSGGYTVPDQFLENILEVTPERSIVRSRATVLPAGENPDAPIEIPTLDYDSGGYQAGVAVYWQDEVDTFNETQPEFANLRLEPKRIGAYCVVSNKLLRNNPGGLDALLTRVFREAMFSAEDSACLTGDGVGKPAGILDADARIDVTRNTASSFKWADVSELMAKYTFAGGGWGNAVWICNASVLPDLVSMVDDGNHRVYVESGQRGLPPTLIGIPVVFSTRTPTLGNRGDVMLCDLSYYLVKQGFGPDIFVSEHPYATSDKTVIVFQNNIDGSPWIKAPLPAEDGTEYSPFVILE